MNRVFYNEVLRGQHEYESGTLLPPLAARIAEGFDSELNNHCSVHVFHSPVYCSLNLAVAGRADGMAHLNGT